MPASYTSLYCGPLLNDNTGDVAARRAGEFASPPGSVRYRRKAAALRIEALGVPGAALYDQAA